MSELAQLQEQLSVLVRARAAVMEDCRARMQRANSDFDREALPIRRKIDALQSQPVTQVTRKQRTAKAHISIEDGFTQDEVDRYNELLGKARLVGY